MPWCELPGVQSSSGIRVWVVVATYVQLVDFVHTKFRLLAIEKLRNNRAIFFETET